MKTRTIRGTYGKSKNPCYIYIYERNGCSYYAVCGSVNVNCTMQELVDGDCDVEEIDDIDFFTADAGIESEEDLEKEVIDYTL